MTTQHVDYDESPPRPVWFRHRPNLVRHRRRRRAHPTFAHRRNRHHLLNHIANTSRKPVSSPVRRPSPYRANPLEQHAPRHRVSDTAPGCSARIWPNNAPRNPAEAHAVCHVDDGKRRKAARSSANRVPRQPAAPPHHPPTRTFRGVPQQNCGDLLHIAPATPAARASTKHAGTSCRTVSTAPILRITSGLHSVLVETSATVYRQTPARGIRTLPPHEQIRPPLRQTKV